MPNLLRRLASILVNGRPSPAFVPDAAWIAASDANVAAERDRAERIARLRADAQARIEAERFIGELRADVYGRLLNIGAGVTA